MVMLDLQLNPGRVTQIAGRVQRIGSHFDQVYIFQLLANDTQEERYQAALSARQALYDYVHDEEAGELFEKLDAVDLMKLITP